LPPELDGAEVDVGPAVVVEVLIPTCGDFMPAPPSAFWVTSSYVGSPSLMPRLMNSLFGTLCQGVA
jgi:hypothetical protein